MSKNPVMYLVDVENVGNRWIHLVNELHVDDKMVLFYSESSMKFTFDNLKDVGTKMNYLSFVRCFNGNPNALDFQLSGCLGYLMALFPEYKYKIVSNDSGYDTLIRFFKGMHMNVCRCTVADGYTEKSHDVIIPEKRADTPISVTKQQIASVLRLSIADNKVNEIHKLLHNARQMNVTKRRVTRKSYVHNQLQNKYGEQGHKFYHMLKNSGLLKQLE